MEHSVSLGASIKSAVIKKGIALIIIMLAALAATLLVRHYFYIIDSYYYTAEFHLLFMKNNLKSGNMELFADYFKSLGNIMNVFPLLLISNLVQNFWAPFSGSVLAASSISALGMAKGLSLNYISLVLVGLVCFGLGIFFLGDIFSFLKKNGLWKDYGVSGRFALCVTIGVLFSAPFIPVVLPAAAGALIRMPLRMMMVIMAAGFLIRLLLLLLTPGVF